MMKKQNRRNFLKSSGCAGMSAMGAYSSLLNLGLIRNLAADSSSGNMAGDDYKALICIFLAGGNDSFNMLIPTSNSRPTVTCPHTGASWEIPSYGAVGNGDGNSYVEARGGVRASGDSPSVALKLDEVTQEITQLYGDGASGSAKQGGARFGIHGSLAGTVLEKQVNGSFENKKRSVADIYKDGELSFVANVGTLVDRMSSRGDFFTEKRKPRSLFSHNDQIGQWQSALPEQTLQSFDFGWIGRMTDILVGNGNGNEMLPTNLSFNTQSLAQRGKLSGLPYVISGNGAPVFGDDFLGLDQASDVVGTVPGTFATANYHSLFRKAYGNRLKAAVDESMDFKDAVFQSSGDFDMRTKALDYLSGIDSGSIRSFLPGLEGIVRSIYASKCNPSLAPRRQTYFLTIGGWDTHDSILESHSNRMTVLGSLIVKLNQALKELNLLDDVVTFTCSDFGRTLRSNGIGRFKGTDHAWGGNQLVMGGGVHGGEIHGLFPTLIGPSDASSLDISTEGQGRIIPTTSVDEYFADLASWMGVSQNNLVEMLPNLSELGSSVGGNSQPYSGLGLFG